MKKQYTLTSGKKLYEQVLERIKGMIAQGTYQKGDMLEHKAFGRGMVLSTQKVGGDTLLEIAFDGVGTKRLMLKFTAQHMKKL